MNASVFLNGRVTLYGGDSAEILKSVPDNHFHSVVCDPPYGLDFMGRHWDSRCAKQVAFNPEFWAEVYRVLKPGGHVLAFGGTRTVHRLTCAIEDAGFEIRDMVAWLYGSGFPKSHDVSKGIDKRPGVERHPEFASDLRAAMSAKGYTNTFDVAEKVIGRRTGAVANWQKYQWPEAKWWPALRDLLDMSEAKWGTVIAEAERIKTGSRKSGDPVAWYGQTTRSDGQVDITAAATDAARQWEGWGTALKPSQEPVTLARKPLTKNQEWVTVVASLEQLEAKLWSMWFASSAAGHFTSSQSAFGEVLSASAQWSADERSNTQAALSARMGTSQFVSAMSSSLSTVSSWKLTLAELSEHESTSTTETGSSTTTDLRTLKFSVSKITPESIILAHSEGQWSNALACPAARYLNACAVSWSATRERSALANAIAEWQRNSPDEDGLRLSPALEPITVARKPMIGTVAANVLAHGTGALNIAGCRVSGESTTRKNTAEMGYHGGNLAAAYTTGSDLGRWPANLIHDGSDEVVAAFPIQKPSKPGSGGAFNSGRHGGEADLGANRTDYIAPIRGHSDDGGSAARFFYNAKAGSDDRIGSKHPTIKPVDLLRYLVRLVTPPGGTVLDPFAGTGTTGEAAFYEGFNAVLIEREDEYRADIARRMALVLSGPDERKRTIIKTRAKPANFAGTLFAEAAE